jgi:hypothetical protein
MDNGQVGDTAILVLGSHRSGTSATTGVLYRLGVDLGSNLMPAMKENPKGFYEHFGIAPIHNDLITLLDSDWSDPCSLPQDWNRDPRIAPYRERIIQVVKEEFTGKPLWGLKDPRVCRLLPLWHQVLAEVGATGKAIFVMRPPIEVALSLLKRDRMSVEQGLMLWSSHVLDAEFHSRDMARSVIFYQDLLQDWVFEMRRLRDELDIELSAFSTRIIDDVNDFLDSDLRHHRDAAVPNLRAPQSALADKLYEAMLAWRREGISPAAVCDEIRREFSYIERGAAPVASHWRAKAAEARRQAEGERQYETDKRLDAEKRGDYLATVAEQLERDLRESARSLAYTQSVLAAEQAELAAERGRAQALTARLVNREKEIQETREKDAIWAAELQQAKAESDSRGVMLLTRLSTTEARIAQLQHERAKYLSSTSWRVTAPLRGIGTLTPRIFRRGLVGGIKLTWWSLTLQLPRKLRQRRSILLRSQMESLEHSSATAGDPAGMRADAEADSIRR